MLDLLEILSGTDLSTMPYRMLDMDLWFESGIV